MYPRSMSIRVGIMCEKCERVYLLVHPEGSEQGSNSIRCALVPLPTCL